MRFLLLITVGTIFALGLVMIFSTTSAEVLDHDLNKSTHQALLKQITYAIAGIALGIAVWKLGYKQLLQLSPGLGC